MRRALVAAACATVLGAAAVRLLPPQARADADALPIAASGAHIQGDAIAKGAYLTRMADCEACHKGAGEKLTGGRGFKTPFGTIYAPNITPDRETGIGGYTDDEWVAALRKGVGRGGKHLYPAMPYTSYTLMTRDDALAIKAFLMTQPAAHAAAPANDMSFPFNIRFLMVFWNLLNNPDHTFAQDAAHDASWNRGAYLAEALGHCQQCHTPRNILQGLKTGHAYAGAVQQGWLANNITSAGLATWQPANLTAYLSTGRADGHGVAAGPMAEAVSYSLRHLTPEDAASLASYLKTIPAQDAPPPPPASTQIVGNESGRRIYEGACASCHRADGTGVNSHYAALLGDSSVSDPEGKNLLQMILQGGAIETAQGAVAMPAFAHGYTDAELAAVTNYTIAQLGHVQGQVQAGDIEKGKKIGS